MDALKPSHLKKYLLHLLKNVIVFILCVVTCIGYIHSIQLLSCYYALMYVELFSTSILLDMFIIKLEYF